MRRTTSWAITAALLALPAVAVAQSDTAATTARAPQPAVAAPAAPSVATQRPVNETTTPTAAPSVDAERMRSEIGTTPRPQLDPSTSLAPPAVSDGGGSTSATLEAAADAPSPYQGAAPTPDIGQPTGDWRIQRSVTSLGDYGHWFNDFLLIIMAAVTLFVFGLLAYAMHRFRAKNNPVASRTSHNTLIEFVWTFVPVLILVVIAVPSFRLLADQYDPPEADLTIKAIGNQWYWSYEYPDYGDGVGFDAVMLSEQESAKRGAPRLLETDNRVIVPAGATVKVLVTAADVLHAWAVPAFWVKMDAVPGRINETWFKVDRPGVYYGQCSELCGTKHGFMPIAVEVVEPETFNAWMAAQQAEAGVEATGPRFVRGANGALRTVAATAPASQGATVGNPASAAATTPANPAE